MARSGSRSRRSPAADPDVVERNGRALRVAGGPQGESGVFRAAVSRPGVEAVCSAASVLSESRGSPWPVPSYRNVLSVRLPDNVVARRMHGLASVLVMMERDHVEVGDAGWAVGRDTLRGVAVDGIPRRVPPADGAGSAGSAVVRSLADICGVNGLSMLAVVAERAGLPEPVQLNTHGAPLLPASLAAGVPVRLSRIGPGAPPPVVPTSMLSEGWLPALEGHGSAEAPVIPFPLYSLLTVEPGRARGGHGADLALRIFIEGVTAVMRQDWRRAVRQVVGVTVPLREFLSWFYDGSRRQPRPTEYWPVLLAACHALDRQEARFPYSVDGGGMRRVVSFADLPRGAGRLDDNVTLCVHLPPGSSEGPAINRMRLRYWGWTSAPAYRALLGLAYHWFRPGLTRVRDKGGEWVQSRDRDRYEPFSDEGLIALCYPTSSMRRRRRLRDRAVECLQRLHAAGDLVLAGRRVLPPPGFP